MRISDWSSDVCSSDLLSLSRLSSFVCSLATSLLDEEPPLPELAEVSFPTAWACGFIFWMMCRRLNTKGRSEERRLGTVCVRPCRARWSPTNSKHTRILDTTQHRVSVMIHTVIG